MVSLLLTAPFAPDFQPRAREGKALPPALRRVFAVEFPGLKGDNCLLTAGFAFIDLAFSRLLA
jgi:hypothetical protein